MLPCILGATEEKMALSSVRGNFGVRSHLLVCHVMSTDWAFSL